MALVGDGARRRAGQAQAVLMASSSAPAGPSSSASPRCRLRGAQALRLERLRWSMQGAFFVILLSSVRRWARLLLLVCRAPAVDRYLARGGMLKVAGWPLNCRDTPARQQRLLRHGLVRGWAKSSRKSHDESPSSRLCGTIAPVLHAGLPKVTTVAAAAADGTGGCASASANGLQTRPAPAWRAWCVRVPLARSVAIGAATIGGQEPRMASACHPARSV